MLRGNNQACNSTPKHLLTSDMDFAKKISDLQVELSENLKSSIQLDYRNVIDAIKFERTSISTFKVFSKKRCNYLVKVQQAFESYLIPETISDMPYALFYLMLYYMEKSQLLSNVYMEDEDNIYFECETEEISKILIFMLGQFRNSMIFPNPKSIVESFLKSILM